MKFISKGLKLCPLVGGLLFFSHSLLLAVQTVLVPGRFYTINLNDGQVIRAAQVLSSSPGFVRIKMKYNPKPLVLKTAMVANITANQAVNRSTKYVAPTKEGEYQRQEIGPSLAGRLFNRSTVGFTAGPVVFPGTIGRAVNYSGYRLQLDWNYNPYVIRPGLSTGFISSLKTKRHLNQIFVLGGFDVSFYKNRRLELGLGLYAGATRLQLNNDIYARAYLTHFYSPRLQTVFSISRRLAAKLQFETGILPEKNVTLISPSLLGGVSYKLGP